MNIFIQKNFMEIVYKMYKNKLLQYKNKKKLIKLINSILNNIKTVKLILNNAGRIVQRI